MKTLALVMSMLALLVLAGPAQALILVQSTFDAGDEGWRTGEFFSTSDSGAPTHVATGGNPGGFIRATDVAAWAAFHAPAAFLGDQSAAYGGFLHVDQRLLTSDGINYPMVVISDGTTQLQFRTTPPSTDWTSYDISLLASAGWEIANGSGNPGPAASEAQLQTVLGNLLFLHLDVDWQTGNDQVDLDNVRLCSGDQACRVAQDDGPQDDSPTDVPLPGTLVLLLAGGLASVAVARARRR